MNSLIYKRGCFKTHVKGGYFGEIEVLSMLPRLFTTCAQDNSTLLAIHGGHIRKIMSRYPNHQFKFMEKTIRRFLMISYSIKKLQMFEAITHKDAFWSEPEPPSEVRFSAEVGKWFELVENVYRTNKVDSPVSSPLRE